MNHKELDGNTFSAYAYEANSFISADIKEFEEILMMYSSFEKKGNSYISKSECNNELQVTVNQQDEIIQSISITVSKYEGEYSRENLFLDIYYLVKYINENYLSAAQAWINCANRVNDFVGDYRGDLNFANQNMENNMIRKSRKAATTIAGEAFEVFRWRPVLNQQNQQNDHYYGPGEHAGVDIRLFPNSDNINATGTAAEEVKSSNELNWRDLFVDVNNVRRIAYLGGQALANAQASPPPIPFYRQYEYHDKANPNGPGALCR